jgi:hypothetical protein
MSRGNRISLREQIKRREPNITGTKNKISQKESQKIEYIVVVIDYAIKHKKFSVSDLQDKLKISRNSLDKTIRLLIERKMITISSIGLKNKKFYKVKSKTRLKEYKNDLNQWQFFKTANTSFLTGKTLDALDKYQHFMSKIQKTMKKSVNRSKFLARKISDLEKILFRFSKEEQKKITDIPYPKPVYLKSIYFHDANLIVKKYNEFLLCDICLKKGILVDLIELHESNERVCPKQGHVFSIEK